MPLLYLASKSPRRRELLASMGVTDIEILTLGKAQLTAYEGDEVQHEGESPADYVVRTASDKAQLALARIRSEGLAVAPVLAADTVVNCNGKVLGKPADKAEAREFMKQLSGNTHEVRTAVVLATVDSPVKIAVSVSQVRFTRMTDEQIESYISLDEPYDKAGGYGIQGMAGQYIEHIAGSYTGIMGLPVFETAKLLRDLGIIKN